MGWNRYNNTLEIVQTPVFFGSPNLQRQTQQKEADPPRVAAYFESRSPLSSLPDEAAADNTLSSELRGNEPPRTARTRRNAFPVSARVAASLLHKSHHKRRGDGTSIAGGQLPVSPQVIPADQVAGPSRHLAIEETILLHVIETSCNRRDSRSSPHTRLSRQHCTSD